MALTSCDPVDNFFIQAPEYIYPNLIYEKYKPTNAWYGVLSEEEFVNGKGTTHTGRRLDRIIPPRPCNDWEPIQVDICSTNACDFDPDLVYHGSDTYNWRIVRKQMRTDWYCLDGLKYEPFTQEEMGHIQDSLLRINRDVQEEFIRGRYIHNILPANKWLLTGTSSDPCVDVCLEPTREAWFFEELPNGEPDTCAIRVGVAVADLDTIAMLNNDMLDMALTERQYVTDDISWVDETMELYPLYLSDVQTSNYLARSLDAAANLMVSLGNNTVEAIPRGMLTDKYGLIKRTAGNFAHKLDKHGMKFYPDTAFNADLPTFDFDDPDTWPRLFRVFPYVREHATIGVKGVVNPYYLKAPFTISVLFHPDAGSMQRIRPVDSYGKATVDEIYDVEFAWNNPPWPCNIKRTKGFFMNEWELAYRPNRPEYAYAFLHRTVYGIHSIDVPTCALTTAPNCPAEAVPYCCVTPEGLAPCETAGGNYVLDTIENITPTIHS